MITGTGGQLGAELCAATPSTWELVAVGHNGLDITWRDSVFEIIKRERPDVILNAAAYTNVDRAETERADAFEVNERGVANLAEACAQFKSRLIHVSTDFVFDGRQSMPYRPTDSTAPANAYGASKLAGEQRVLEVLPSRGMIVRTSWLYSRHGHNFVRTILRLIAERDRLGVVDDQVGSPTWARGLARLLWRAAESTTLAGVFHWADSGAASWYDFAVAIQEESLTAGLSQKQIPIARLRTEEYPTQAARPKYSVLDCSDTVEIFALAQRPWRDQLRMMLRGMVTPPVQ